MFGALAIFEPRICNITNVLRQLWLNWGSQEAIACQQSIYDSHD
jgi:hypothetical protein